MCECARSSASVSARACMSTRVDAPVFVCMCVSIRVSVLASTVLSRLPLVRLICHYIPTQKGTSKQTRTRSQTYRRRGISQKQREGSCRSPAPLLQASPLLVPLPHQASLPNTTGTPLRQNTPPKLDLLQPLLLLISCLLSSPRPPYLSIS